MAVDNVQSVGVVMVPLELCCLLLWTSVIAVVRFDLIHLSGRFACKRRSLDACHELGTESCLGRHTLTRTFTNTVSAVLDSE